MAKIRTNTRSEKIGQCSVMLYSKETAQGNTVYTGYFSDEKTGRIYYLRSTLDTVDSRKKEGKTCAIVNVSVYQARK